METQEVKETEKPEASFQEKLGSFYNLRGIASYKLGKFKEAEENFTKATEFDPGNVVFIKNLADMAFQNSELEKATHFYSVALKIEPERKDIKFRLAKTFVNLKKFDDAFEIDPKSDEIHTLILSQIFRFEGACKKCGACCKNMVLLYHGKLITSEEEFAKICQDSPDFNRWVSFRDGEGNLRFNCGRLDPSSLCSDYQNRQDLCRNYPNYMTSSLKDTCGFKRKIDFNFPPLRNIALVNLIGEHAMKLGLYEEALKLLKFDAKNVSEVSLVFQNVLEGVKP